MSEGRLKQENSFLKEVIRSYYEPMKERLQEKDKEIERLNNIIKDYKSVKEFISEHCIDDEFFINLSNKEKAIVEAYALLKDIE